MPSTPRTPAADPLQDNTPVDPTETSGAEVVADNDLGAAPQDDDGPPPNSGWWRFLGAYACAYTTPDRVSQWIQPGQVVAWPGDLPDANWEPAAEPEPAPVVSDQNTEE